MNKIHNCIFVSIFILSFFFLSCATSPKPAVTERPAEKKTERKIKKWKKPEKKKPVVATEEEKRSLEVFNEILELTGKTNDRKSVLPKAEALYDRIIREYPGAPLAQESYWRLITIYVRDYAPPAYEKAEKRYGEFLEKYPGSAIKGFIVDTLARSYYKHAEWKRLVRLCDPLVKRYIKKGDTAKAPVLFMYAEANYNLGDIAEAERGYKLVVKKFPETTAGSRSRSMLERIKGNLK